jgi:hypothetical protein
MDRTLDTKWEGARDSKTVCLSVHLLVIAMGQGLDHWMDSSMVHVTDRKKEMQWESLWDSLSVCLWGDC